MSYLFGSHVSCQGGLLCGVERAREVGCDCLQVFVCQPRQWPQSKSCIPIDNPKATAKVKGLAAKELAAKDPKAKGLSKSDTEPPCLNVSADSLAAFDRALQAGKFPAPLSHASYLINLASTSEELWDKSVEALVIEWQRSESLKLSGLVMHPGAHLSATPEEGLANIVRGIRAAMDRVGPKHCRLLLENTAGQGSCLGWRFEELGWLIQELSSPERIGVCFDTCHAFAAGHDFSTAAKLKAMWDAFEKHVGLEHLRAVHINDSQKGLGSRVDRHEHIGRGAIGEAAFVHFLKSSPVKHLPMILETPKGTDEETGEDLDIQNLAVLRRLVKKTSR